MARPRTAPQRRISSRIKEPLVERIEAWRLAPTPRPPTQTDALEQLLELGLQCATRSRASRRTES